MVAPVVSAIDKSACPTLIVYHEPMSRRTQPIDLGILLALAYQEFVRQLRETHVEHGFEDIGRSDGYVFRALAGRPMTVSALAARLQISKQGTGQLIDDMERRGYVERGPDPTDARARLIHLSARGNTALRTARQFHRTYQRRLARVHGAAAVATLRTMLEAAAATGEHAGDRQLRAEYL
jgi:DNA-binding MarR family transcriptional regulator